MRGAIDPTFTSFQGRNYHAEREVPLFYGFRGEKIVDHTERERSPISLSHAERGYHNEISEDSDNLKNISCTHTTTTYSLVFMAESKRSYMWLFGIYVDLFNIE